MSQPKSLSAKFLSVYCGDAILLHYEGTDGDAKNILIDGGYVKTYRKILKPELDAIRKRGEHIDLLILTHYDQDHIGGVLAFLHDKDFDIPSFIVRWWTNIDVPFKNINDEISVGQIVKLRTYLKKIGKDPIEPITNELKPFDLDGATITLLSPDRQRYEAAAALIPEDTDLNIGGTGNDFDTPLADLQNKVVTEANEDTAIPNGSSIAMMVEFNGLNYLLLGDSHPSIVAQALNKLGYGKAKRLNVSWVKLAHHGSKFNISNDLLDHIITDTYVISVNGVNQHSLPHKETLVRIIQNGYRTEDTYFNFCFTYDEPELQGIFEVDDLQVQKTLKFELKFPESSSTGYIL